MWWLSFVGGGGVIMEAVSLTQARLLAAANGLGRASQFAEGHSIKPNLAELIPGGSIGRILTPVEARQLLKLMKYGPQKYLPHLRQEPEPGNAMRGRGTQ
jgi:hypothetical protein